MKKSSKMNEMTKEIVDVTKMLVERVSDDFVLDLSSYMDDFVSHVLYIPIEDARQNRFLSYNGNIYASAFDAKTGLLQYIIIFSEDLIYEEEETIEELFGDIDVYVRGLNSFHSPNNALGTEGFWILQNGEIHFRYKYPNDGYPINKEDYEERGGGETSINLN